MGVSCTSVVFWLLIQTFSSRDAYVAFSLFDLGKGIQELQVVALKPEGGMLQSERGADAVFPACVGEAGDGNYVTCPNGNCFSSHQAALQ